LRKHTIEHRVTYKETDQMRVVYYSNYLVWFEMARTELFRATGLSYRKIEEEENIYLPVIEVECRYRAPVRYDDIIFIETVVSSMGRTRIIFDYEVKVNSELKAEGRTHHVFVNDRSRPVLVPESVRVALCPGTTPGIT
jgi:acyl-CoA thioester hydrolase